MIDLTPLPAHCFRDVKGRKYTTFISADLAIHLKEKDGIDLADLSDESFHALARDAQTLIGVLWMTAEDSAKELGVDAKEFARSLGGDSLEDAIDALQEAIILFSRRSFRTVLRKMAEKGKEIDALAQQKMLQAVAKIDPEHVLTSFSTASNKPPSPESPEPT